MKKKKEDVVEITVTRRITVKEKTCPVCGTTFMGPTNKRFCGRPCLNKASYEKHAEARREHRRKVYHAERQASAGKK